MGAPDRLSLRSGDDENQRNPAKEHRTDRNTQVTLGDAKSVVAGEVIKSTGTIIL